MVLIKNYSEISFCEKEILRYLKAEKKDGFSYPFEECIKEAKKALKYRVCYIEADVKIKLFSMKSEIKDFAKL